MTYAVDGDNMWPFKSGMVARTSRATRSTSSAAAEDDNVNRIIAFKLGGEEVPNPRRAATRPFPTRQRTRQARQRSSTAIKFIEQCSRCHGFSAERDPGSSEIPPVIHDQFKNIVLKGALAPAGMESFSGHP